MYKPNPKSNVGESGKRKKEKEKKEIKNKKEKGRKRKGGKIMERKKRARRVREAHEPSAREGHPQRQFLTHARAKKAPQKAVGQMAKIRAHKNAFESAQIWPKISQNWPI